MGNMALKATFPESIEKWRRMMWKPRTVEEMQGRCVCSGNGDACKCAGESERPALHSEACLSLTSQLYISNDIDDINHN
jgi:hypothetical protein